MLTSLTTTMRTDASGLEGQGGDLALLGLLQLVSPALPIGAFAFSQGLESAFELGWVRDEASLGDWLEGVLDDGLTRCELPVLARLHVAWAERDGQAIAEWDAWLAANRETAELAAEDTRLGASLARLLGSLDRLPGSLSQDSAPPDSSSLESPSREAPALPPGVGYITLFAWTAHMRGVTLRQALLGFAWSWLENQLAVACKALPLGHTAAQRLVERLRPLLVAAVDESLSLDDDDLGPVLPGLALASALHETQYSRLFRS